MSACSARQIELARVDDGPVAALHFGVGVADVDELRGNLLAAVDDLDRHDLAPARSIVVFGEHDDGVLHGDEVPVAQVSGGPVVGLAEVVVGVELDEARTPIAQQLNGEESHLALQLLFDFGDDLGAGRVARGQMPAVPAGCTLPRVPFPSSLFTSDRMAASVAS